MTRKNIAAMEADAARFWTLARSHAAVKRAFVGTGANRTVARDVRKGLRDLAARSDWPLLQARVRALLGGTSPARARE